MVALGAEGDEVLLVVVAESAPGTDVMHLEIGRAVAVLAAPAVPVQNLLA